MLALALLYSTPILSKRVSLASSSSEVALSYATILVTSAVFGVLPFFSGLGGTDVLSAMCLGYGMSFFMLCKLEFTPYRYKRK